MAQDKGQGDSDRPEKETVRRAHRGQTLLIVFGLIVVAALAGFMTVVLLSDRRQETADLPGVQSFDDLSKEHTDGYVSYEQTPPVGGVHNPIWQDAGFYDEPVPEERAVHTLEHGAVWITYSFDLPQEEREKLRQVVESQDCLLASPYPYLPAPVVASAWGKQLQLESVDDPNLQEFIRTYRKGPQTPEPDAPCTGAAEMRPPSQESDQ